MTLRILFCKICLQTDKVKVAQSCPTLCDPMDYTVRGILQARILEWVAFPFSRSSSQTRDQTQVSHVAGGSFTSWPTREAPNWQCLHFQVIFHVCKREQTQMWLWVPTMHWKMFNSRQEEKGQQRMRWLGSITNSKDTNLRKLLETVEDRGAWRAAARGVTKSGVWLSNWTTAAPLVSWHACCARHGFTMSLSHWQRCPQHFHVRRVFCWWLHVLGMISMWFSNCHFPPGIPECFM